MKILILFTRPHANTEWICFWKFREEWKIVVFNGSEKKCFEKIPSKDQITRCFQHPNDVVIFIYTYWFLNQQNSNELIQQLIQLVNDIKEFASENNCEFQIKVHTHSGGQGYESYEGLINSLFQLQTYISTYSLGDNPETNDLAGPYRELRKRMENNPNEK